MAPVNVRISPLGMVLISAGIIALIFYTMRGYKGYKNTCAEDPQVETVSLKALLSASIDLAKKGGLKVKQVRDASDMKEEVKGLTEEGAKELKTSGDMQSHIQIVHGFNQGFPKLKIISEEKEQKVSNVPVPCPVTNSVPPLSINDEDEEVKWDDVVVWVDPLDATQEYTEKLLQYVTTMVCVVVKGKPVIGVIHNPFNDSTSWAWIGHGHSKDLELSNRRTKPDNTASRIIISRSHAGQMKEAAEKAFQDGLQLISAGGAGYKVLSLFKGISDAYVHVTKIKKWDICAGNAILNALHGRMTTLKGEEIDYTSSSAVNDGLLATLDEHEKFLKPLTPVYQELVKEHSSK